VEDIMRDQHYEAHQLLSVLLDECSDEIETLLAEAVGEKPGIEKIRARIDEIFGKKAAPSQKIYLHEFVRNKLDEIRPRFSHRKIDILTSFEKVPAIEIPVDPLAKVVLGLIRNAVENTPDGSKIEIMVKSKGDGVEFSVHDYGVGIVPEHQKRIFEGFFTTQATMDYSSKSPYDFNAGGQGADLLRMRIFAERYNFQIHMHSSRCRFIPLEKDGCPGDIRLCKYCEKKEDCYLSGGSTFTVFFPSASSEKNPESS
jgi:signal transduction histidine kinase